MHISSASSFYFQLISNFVKPLNEVIYEEIILYTDGNCLSGTCHSGASPNKIWSKGGLNVSKLHLSEETFKSDNRTGFFIGPTAEFTLPLLGLGIDASAMYNQFGVDSEEGTSTKKV